jgi:hypothetical protein
MVWARHWLGSGASGHLGGQGRRRQGMDGRRRSLHASAAMPLPKGKRSASCLARWLPCTPSMAAHGAAPNTTARPRAALYYRLVVRGRPGGRKGHLQYRHVRRPLVRWCEMPVRRTGARWTVPRPLIRPTTEYVGLYTAKRQGNQKKLAEERNRKACISGISRN